MKKMFSLLLTFAFFLSAFAQQSFELLTKKPTPGSVLRFEYMPRNTVLQGVKNFEATAFLFEGKLPRAIVVPMIQEGGIFKGSVKTADSTRAVFFSFAKEDKVDNNNDSGYYTVLYDKTGKQVLGSNNELAQAFQSFGSFLFGLKPNPEKAMALNELEFANPLAQTKLVANYLQFLSQSKNEAHREKLKTELEAFAKKKETTEGELSSVKYYYERTFKDKEKGAAIQALIEERFPEGFWKRDKAIQNISTAATLADKVRLYNDFLKTYVPAGKVDKNLTDRLNMIMANAYAGQKDYTTAASYFARMDNQLNAADMLNNLAWKLSGEGINGKPENLEAGLLLSKQSLVAVEKERKERRFKQPFQTEKNYENSISSSYHMYADTYATLLYHKGDYAQAYAYQKAAVQGNGRVDATMNETYAVLAEKVKGPKEAQAELELFFETGRYTPAMKEQLQRLYTAGGKSEAEWTVYVGNIEARAYNKIKEEVAKKMINSPAPMFALKDLNGKQVDLASMKGKVVVVDFWATWCGPCLASFPGMQMAVTKFKDNPDVAFLFIDTWENDSNRTQKVTDFIAKNNYDFTVLYDETKSKESEEFKVVQQFGVEGIPTKFVIDKSGVIRFKSVGFGGSADALLSELSIMIEMAGADGSPSVKKVL